MTLFEGFLTLLIIGIIIYFKIYWKSTIEDSIGHYFNIKLAEFNQQFESKWRILDRKDKYLLAALDERLKVTQIAYRYSRKMRTTLHNKTDRPGVMLELIKYWDENSLYLSNEARKAFHDAMISYGEYEQLQLMVRENKQNPEAHKRETAVLLAAFEKITNLASVLEQSVDLDNLGAEKESITPMGEQDGDRVQ